MQKPRFSRSRFPDDGDAFPFGFTFTFTENLLQKVLVLKPLLLLVPNWYDENSNLFSINGQTFDICIQGKPDIVAIRPEPFIVEYPKTGQRKAFHRLQFLIYMMLLPLAPETESRCKGFIPERRLVYPDGVVEIPTSDVDFQFKELFKKTVAMISNPQPGRIASSFWKCRFCDISAEYCPARLD